MSREDLDDGASVPDVRDDRGDCHAIAQCKLLLWSEHQCTLRSRKYLPKMLLSRLGPLVMITLSITTSPLKVHIGEASNTYVEREETLLITRDSKTEVY
jgi:hypothetical protein